MKYRALDANGDYSFGNGNGNFYKDVPEAVRQAVVTRLRLWSGEWFLDTTEGTAWQAGVLGKTAKATADGVIRERVLNTMGVSGITAFSSSVNADLRTYTVAVTISTIYGPAQINEIL